jgi:hypothetical protein
MNSRINKLTRTSITAVPFLLFLLVALGITSALQVGCSGKSEGPGIEGVDDDITGGYGYGYGYGKRPVRR